MPYENKAGRVGRNADAEIAALKAEIDRLNSIIVQQDQALLEKNAELELCYQQISDLKVAKASLEATVSSQQSTISTLNLELATADSKIASLTAQIDTLKVQVADLEAALAACEGAEPPLPTEPVSLFGSATGKHTYDQFTQMAGQKMQVRRSYDTWPAAHPREDAGRCASVWSFKPPLNQLVTGQIDEQVKTALMTVPDDGFQRDVIIWHEPEDNISAGEFTFAQYRDGNKRVRKLVNEVNATRKTPIRFGANWMAWTFENASNRNPENYWAGDGVWDFLAFDGYSGRNKSTGTWTGGRTPDALFAEPFAYAKAKGVRPAVAETGIDVLAPEPDRVAWIKACRKYAAGANCEFWCYWDGSFSTFWLNTEAEFKAVVIG
jgi:uncharacterized coiled-coil protein SlyX